MFIVLCKNCCPLLFGRVKMAAGQSVRRLQKAVIVSDSHVYWLNWFLESAGPS